MPRCFISDVSDYKGFIFRNMTIYLVTRGLYVEVAYVNKSKALRTARNYGGDVYEGVVYKYIDKTNFVVNIKSKYFSYLDYLALKESRESKKRRKKKIE